MDRHTLNENNVDLLDTKQKVEHSCGVLVFRPHRMSILLVQPRAGGRWGIPKGHIESGESREECARREVAEETGIRPVGELIFAGRTSTPVDGGGIKYVDIFISFDHTDDCPNPQYTEVYSATFFPIDNLPSLVWYQSKIIHKIVDEIMNALQLCYFIYLSP